MTSSLSMEQFGNRSAALLEANRTGVLREDIRLPFAENPAWRDTMSRD